MVTRMGNSRSMLPYYVAALVGAIFVFIVSLITDSVVTSMLSGLLAGVVAGSVIAYNEQRRSKAGRRRKRR